MGLILTQATAALDGSIQYVVENDNDANSGNLNGPLLADGAVLTLSGDRPTSNTFDLSEWSFLGTSWTINVIGMATVATLTLEASGYVNCLSDDVGKVVMGGTSGATGVLDEFDNTTRTWTVSRTSSGTEFAAGESLSITSGTGAGNIATVSDPGDLKVIVPAGKLSGTTINSFGDFYDYRTDSDNPLEFGFIADSDSLSLSGDGVLQWDSFIGSYSYSPSNGGTPFEYQAGNGSDPDMVFAPDSPNDAVHQGVMALASSSLNLRHFFMVARRGLPSNTTQGMTWFSNRSDRNNSTNGERIGNTGSILVSGTTGTEVRINGSLAEKTGTTEGSIGSPESWFILSYHPEFADTPTTATYRSFGNYQTFNARMHGNYHLKLGATSALTRDKVARIEWRIAQDMADDSNFPGIASVQDILDPNHPYYGTAPLAVGGAQGATVAGTELQLTIAFSGIPLGWEGRAHQGSQVLKHEQSITGGVFTFSPPANEPVTYTFTQPGFITQRFVRSISSNQEIVVDVLPDPSYEA